MTPDEAIHTKHLGATSQNEVTVNKEMIYQGKIITVEKHQVSLPGGRTTTREVVLHPGAVAVLVEPSKDHLILVEQFRKSCEDKLWEIPAGKLEPGEEPKLAAIRELSEETGYQAQTIEWVHTFYTSPGFANERIHLFYTNELTTGEIHLDEDEFLECALVHKSTVLDMLAHNQIQDAKTLLAIYWWLNRAGHFE